MRVWNTTTGEELHRLRGHQNPVSRVAWSPDGARIVSTGFDDKIVRVWDAATGEELGCLHEHRYPVTLLAWYPHGAQIISASSEDQTVRVWKEVLGWKRLFRGHAKWVISGGWNWHGAFDDMEKRVRNWNAARARQRRFWLGGGLDCQVTRAGNEIPIAYYPNVLRHRRTAHPFEPKWAGSEANHLHLITLEGGAEP
jgi:WD40 repeat protein